MQAIYSSTGSLAGVDGLARQIALPGHFGPLRYPSFPALERTAVIGFTAPVTLPLPTAAPTSVTVFRSPSYPVWADVTTSYFAVATAQLRVGVFPAVASGAEVAYEPLPAYNDISLSVRAATSVQIGVSACFPGTVYPILGADVREGLEFVYVPPGTAVRAIFYSGTSVLPAGTGAVNLDVWNAPGEVAQIVVAGSSAGVNRGAMTNAITAVTGLWIRVAAFSFAPTLAAIVPADFSVVLVVASGNITYTGSLTNAGSIAQTNAPTSMHIPLSHPTEFSFSRLPWESCRTTAVSFLGTNVTQVLNKGGTVLGGRLSPMAVNAWKATSSNVSGLHPAEKAFMPLETGVYTYCPPSTDLARFSCHVSNESGGALPYPLMDLSNDALYNKLFLSPAGVVESLACTITWHMEFRTSSALFQLGLCGLTLESLHQAQLVLAQAGYFFENPRHDFVLSRIISSAKRSSPKGRKPKRAKQTDKPIRPKPGPSRPQPRKGLPLAGTQSKKKANNRKRDNRKKK